MVQELTNLGCKSQVRRKINATVIFATHDPLEAIFVAARIVVISNKRQTMIKKIVTVNSIKTKRSNL